MAWDSQLCCKLVQVLFIFSLCACYMLSRYVPAHLMSSKAVFFVSCILPQSIFSLHLLNCHLYKLLIIFFSYNKFHQSNFDFNIIHLHNAVHVASWIIWMTSNVLSCNYSKTEFLLLIGLGQQLAT